MVRLPLRRHRTIIEQNATLLLNDKQAGINAVNVTMGVAVRGTNR